MFGLDGALSAVGSIAGSVISANSQKKINQQNLDYADTMSRTAHQREVADLRAAGLNPLLSVGGSGEQAVPYQAENPYHDLADSVSRAGTAVARSRLAKEAEQTDANIKTQKLDSWSNYITAMATADKVNQDNELSKANTQYQVAQLGLMRELYSNLPANMRMQVLARHLAGYEWFKPSNLSVHAFGGAGFSGDIGGLLHNANSGVGAFSDFLNSILKNKDKFDVPSPVAVPRGYQAYRFLTEESKGKENSSTSQSSHYKKVSDWLFGNDSKPSVERKHSKDNK